MANTEFNYVLNFQSNIEKVTADTQKLLDSLDKTSLEYEKVTIEARKLEQAQLRVAEANDKYAQSLNQSEEERSNLLRQIDAATLAYDRQVVASSRAIAGITNMTRNVALSARGFNSLSNSVNQIGREIPNFAQSAEIGFRALSNNIGPLVDSFDQIRQRGGGVGTILKELKGAIFSFNSAITIAVTLLTVFGPKLFDMALGAEDAKEAIDDLNKSLKEQEEILKNDLSEIQNQGEAYKLLAKIRGESAIELSKIDEQTARQELDRLLKERDVQDARLELETKLNNAIVKGQEGRAQAQLLIQKKYNVDQRQALKILSNITEEENEKNLEEVKKSQKEAAKAVKDANNNLVNINLRTLGLIADARRDSEEKDLAKRKAYFDKLLAEERRLLNELDKIYKAAIDIRLKDAETAFDTELRHLEEKYADQIKVANETYALQQRLYKGNTKELERLAIRHKEVMGRITDAQLIETTNLTVKYDKIMQKNVEDSRNRVLKIREEINKFEVRFIDDVKKAEMKSNLETYTDELKTLNAKITAAKENHTLSKEEEKAFKEENKAIQEEYLAKDKQAIDKAEAAKNEILTKWNKLQIFRRGTELTKRLEFLKEEHSEDKKALNNLYFNNLLTQEEYNKKAAELDKKYNKDRILAYSETAIAIADFALQFAEAGADLGAAKRETRLNELQQEFDTRNAILDAQREKELSNENLTAKQKDEINKKYAKQKLANDLALEKENNKLKKRTFDTDKALQISRAVINTAAGIVQALGTEGWAGIAHAAAIAAMGAIQIATISATKFNPTQTAANAAISADFSTGVGGGSTAQETAQGQPNISFIGSSNNQLANTISGNLTHRGTPVFKTYVLASDVTSQAQLDRQLLAKNTI